MSIVTLRGLWGTLTPEVCLLVAKGIQGDYVNREVIERISKQLNRPHTDIIEKEEHPSGFLERILESLGKGAIYGAQGISLESWEIPLEDTRYLEALTKVIEDLASSPSIVIRGRGSQFILKDNPRAFHVFIVAPLVMRVQNMMAYLKVDEATAKKEIERVDSSRRAFIKKYFQADLEDPIHYDLVINTRRLTFEAAADVIIQAVTRFEHKT